MLDATKPYKENTLFIIRGLPGAGKSTIGAALCGELSVISADDYFTDENYEYHFDASKLSEAHDWCYNEVKKGMLAGITPLAVANTFTKLDYMRPYYDLAKEYGYNVMEITVKSGFASIHGVPDAVMDKMRKEFEPSLGGNGKGMWRVINSNIAECSACRRLSADVVGEVGYAKYCAVCGAKMEGVQ